MDSGNRLIVKPTIDVVIITYCRPDHVRSAVQHLTLQTTAPEQIFVVDASPNRLTEDIVSCYPRVRYIHNKAGAGNMTNSRNAVLGYLRSTVTAFLDDDAYAHSDYIERLTAFLIKNPSVTLGCCRALNGVPGEEGYTELDSIGRFAPNGAMTGNFAADPGRDIPIDHGLGATMWIRRDLLERLGGFREFFGGTAAREDTDLFLRARQLGSQPWFVHSAVVDHVGAPQMRGRRFDRRYTYWTAHNHALLMMAHCGLVSFTFGRSFVADIAHHLSYGPSRIRRLARCAVVTAGWSKGVWDSVRIFGAGPISPLRGYRRPARL